ncbi:ion transporter, partial [Thioclava sp. JE_KL1]|nr:ion transporter [Thioclava sp. JE_KL1]MPQ96257.1 ion transporter [Thioclava sp. JE_KL1]
MTLRDRIAMALDTSTFRNTITAVILFNALLLGLETSERAMALAGDLIRLL